MGVDMKNGISTMLLESSRALFCMLSFQFRESQHVRAVRICG